MKKLYLLLLLCVAQIAGAQTISEKLISVNDAKQNIKAAIASKSVDMTGVPFTEYHLSIASITSGAKGTALAADVLVGKTFSNDTDIGIAGTMPDNGAVTITPGAATQSIPLGYHNGSGIVEAISAENLYGYNIASGVEILGVTGTLEPIASISYSMVTQVELGATGTAGDLFMSEGFISEVGQPLKTAAQDANPAGKGRGAALSADGQYLAVAHDVSPFLSTYKWSVANSRYEKTAAQDANPAGSGYGAALSSDGQYLAVAHDVSPFLTTYKWSVANSRYEKTSAQDVNPAGIGTGAALSSDGQYLAVAHYTAPFLSTYKWSVANSRYEKTVAQDVNPAGTGRGAALSADGQYLAVAHYTAPFLSTYKWSVANSRYEKTAAQDANPAGSGYGAALSSDGQYLAVAYEVSPFLTTYKWSVANSRYEKTAAQDVNPAGIGVGVALSSDGQYLAVAHYTAPFLTTYKWSVANSRYEKTSAQDVNPAGNGFGAALSSDGQYLAVAYEVSPFLTTYKVATTEIFQPAIPLTTGVGYSSIPFNARMIGALLKSGSASDTVDFAQIWRRN